APIQNQELLSHQNGLSNNATETTGLPSRMMVTIAYRKRVKMSRMRGWYQTEQAQEFRMLAEFAYHRMERRPCLPNGWPGWRLPVRLVQCLVRQPRRSSSATTGRQFRVSSAIATSPSCYLSVSQALNGIPRRNTLGSTGGDVEGR